MMLECSGSHMSECICNAAATSRTIKYYGNCQSHQHSLRSWEVPTELMSCVDIREHGLNFVDTWGG